MSDTRTPADREKLADAYFKKQFMFLPENIERDIKRAFVAGFEAALSEPTDDEVLDALAEARRKAMRAVLTAFVRIRKQRSNDE